MTAIAADINPWEVGEEDFPEHASEDDILTFCLHFAILAPSGHNTQPWLFSIRDGLLHLYADRTRALPVVDPDDRELIISCGAALFHLRAALAHFGYQPVVARLPDPAHPDLLATVRIGPHAPVRTHNSDRIRAMRNRRTTRVAFEDRAIPHDVLVALTQAAAMEGVWAVVATDIAIKQELAQLIAEGDRHQMANRHFRRELAAWMHPMRGKTHDGLSGYGTGMRPLLDPLTPVAAAVVRTFDMGSSQAATDMALATGSPALIVIGTETDTPETWLATGEALASVLLEATSRGVRASFLNQPIEVTRLRPLVAETVARSGYPQLLLRIGYGPERLPAPRRPLYEVLVSPDSIMGTAKDHESRHSP